MTSTYREIKFRFFSNPDKKMYVLTLLGLNWEFEGDPSVYEGKNVWDGREGTRVQKYSDGHLMQLTGLRDKNGKDIYEGDIVKFKTFKSFDTEELIWVKGSVIWRDSQYCWYVTGEENNYLSHIIKHGIEVIGNLYENPELIGGVLNNENKTI